MPLDGNNSTSILAPRLSGWPALPMEIRWQIRDYIRTLVSDWPDHKPPLPQLPRVCREWNRWFAHENFKFLVLDQDRPHDFDMIVSRDMERRHFVRYIVLRIRLPEYNCPACDEEEDDVTAYANDSIFMDTMRRFLAIVSRWTEQDPCTEYPWFTLDLGVYSPSDGKHGFRDFRLSQDCHYGATSDMYKQHALDLRKSREADDGKSACPGWNRLCKGLAPCMAAKKRVMSTIGDPRRPHFSDLCINEDERDPEPRALAHTLAVRSLVIRRHYYRQISPQLLQGLIDRFCLHNFHHEAWKHPDVTEAEVFAGKYKDVLKVCMPRSAGTRHCNLVWEPNPILEPTDTPESPPKPRERFIDHPGSVWWHLPDTDDSFVDAYSSNSFSSIGFVSAEEVLQDYHPKYREPPSLNKIPYLILTSKVLQRREPPNSRAFIDLIVETGSLAFVWDDAEPHGLVLWDGNETDGVLFRFTQTYEFRDDSYNSKMKIKWRSTRHTADDLAPAFAALRRELGEPNEDHIVHEQMFEGEHLFIRDRSWMACETMFSAAKESTAFPEIQALLLHPESARQRAFEELALEESLAVTE